jgi:hypothetical protein
MSHSSHLHVWIRDMNIVLSPVDKGRPHTEAQLNSLIPPSAVPARSFNPTAAKRHTP